MTYDFSKRFPDVHPDTFVADSAQLFGYVVLGKGGSVWHNVVLRGDINDIIIGEETNIQDNSVLHVADNYKVSIGKGCTVGHTAIVHACTVGDNSLIGMGAIIMDGAVIGNNCIVAAGALVTPGKSFPDNSLIVGSPAKVRRSVTDKEIEHNQLSAKKYIEVWKAYITTGIPYYKTKQEIQL